MQGQITHSKPLSIETSTASQCLLPTVAAAPAIHDKLSTTPNLILGPFYPVMPPVGAGADLLSEHSSQFPHGPALTLSGRVLNQNGQPVANALVEIWHADALGRYAHTSAPRPVPADPAFTGYGATNTGTDGHYQFRTLQPGAYMENGRQRAPHIHFQVTGQHDRLVTQMFFPNDPLRDGDRLFRAATRPLQLIATRDSENEEPLRLRWDIVLRNG